MKNLTKLHSNIDSLLVSYNIDHNVRNDVKRLMERKDSEYIAIDEVFEVINEVAQTADQNMPLELVRRRVKKLKGGE